MVSEFNPSLAGLNKLIRNGLPLLYGDRKMKTVFPENLLKKFTKEVRI